MQSFSYAKIGITFNFDFSMSMDQILWNGPTYNSSNRTNNSKRGGTTILVRNNISECVYDIDRSMSDQIWFGLSYMPNVLIGGC